MGKTKHNRKIFYGDILINLIYVIEIEENLQEINIKNVQ